jgi:hypothetical protein
MVLRRQFQDYILLHCFNHAYDLHHNFRLYIKKLPVMIIIFIAAILLLIIAIIFFCFVPRDAPVLIADHFKEGPFLYPQVPEKSLMNFLYL